MKYRTVLSWLSLIVVLALLLPAGGPPVQAAAPAESESLPPIILLNGIMGSNLYNAPTAGCGRPEGEIWLNLWGLLNPFDYNWRFTSLYLQADGRTPQNNCDHIYSDGVVMLVYQPVITALQNAGYSVHPYGFDWRLSLEVNAQRLDSYIASLGVPKVILVTHSMGGLLARRYTANPTWAQRVQRVITIAAPYWGAPILAKHMRAGTVPLPYDLLLDNDNVWQGIRNFPGAMQLLPSPAYFTQAGGYYIKGNELLLSFDATRTFFGSKDQNLALIDQARTFHQSIDDFRGALNVPYDILAASHLASPSHIREYTCWWFFTCWEERTYAMGDGTVPWASASLSGAAGDWSGQANVCNFTSGHVTEDHGNITKDANVIADLLNLLAGRSPVHCRYTNQEDGGEDAAQPFVQVSLWGRAQLGIRDAQGNYAGLDENGTAVNAIPLATYDADANHVVATLPYQGSYHLLIQQNSAIPLQIKVTEFHPDGQGGFSPVQRSVFVDVSLAEKSLAEATLTPTEGLAGLRFVLDSQSEAPRSVEASATLEGAALEDMTPPATRITVLSGEARKGGKDDRITVTLAAGDEASGIFKTEYSLDGGKTWQLYTAPLQLRRGQFSEVQARSVDRAGNQEMPWPAARLQP